MPIGKMEARVSGTHLRAMFPHKQVRVPTPGPRPNGPWEPGPYKTMLEKGPDEKTLHMRDAVARTIKKEAVEIAK